MRLDSATLAILSNLKLDGVNVTITQQLDRKAYTKVNEVLTHLGGKWNRKAKAHVFFEDPADLIDAVIVSGEVDVEAQKLMGYFPTPAALVKEMMRAGQLGHDDTVLEPSAGTGAIAAEVLGRLGHSGSLTCVEIDPGRFKTLEATLAPIPHVGKLTLHNGNFLTQKPAERFSLILMNPPFAQRQDIAHIRWAYNWLAPGGRLVAIASAGVEFREDKTAQAFRQWAGQVPSSFRLVKLPEGSFKSSGTGVNTVMIVLRRASAAVEQADAAYEAEQNELAIREDMSP